MKESVKEHRIPILSGVWYIYLILELKLLSNLMLLLVFYCFETCIAYNYTHNDN